MSSENNSVNNKDLEAGVKDGEMNNTENINEQKNTDPAKDTSHQGQQQQQQQQQQSGEAQQQGGASGCARKASGGCSGCPNKGSCSQASSAINETVYAIIRERLAGVKNIVLILSGKGGVGKSTVCTQLAYTLSQLKGKHVGIMDIDICGPSIPTLTGTVGSEVNQIGGGWIPVRVTENGSLSVLSVAYLLPGRNDPVIWRGPRKTSLIQNFLSNAVWGELDYLIIDTPPGTSDEHISVLSFLSDALPERQASCIIVTTPQEVALADVRREANFCKAVNLPVIGVIENMSGFVCPHCGELTQVFRPSTGGAEAMCNDPAFGLKFLGSVPLDVSLARASEQGVFWQALVEEGKPDAAGFKDFVAIAELVEKILE